MAGNFLDNDGGGCSSAGSTYIFVYIYYWTRNVLIAVNIVVFLLISIRLHYLVKLLQTSSGGGGGEATPAIAALVRRIKYYPLVQVLCRRFYSGSDSSCSSSSYSSSSYSSSSYSSSSSVNSSSKW